MSINKYGHNSDIDFQEIDKQMFSFWKWWFSKFKLWFVFCGLLSLVFTGVIVYTAWHFISKHW